MQHVVSSIMDNQVLDPIRQIMAERQQIKKNVGHTGFRSMYREMMFLSMIALGRDNIDQGRTCKENSIFTDYVAKLLPTCCRFVTEVQ